MRAHRPGRVGSDEFDEDFQRQRQEKIEVYAQRAKQGLPLFDLLVPPRLSTETMANSMHS